MTGPPSLPLYLDKDCQSRALRDALVHMQISVLTSSVAGMDGASDFDQLEFATAHRRVLVSSNIADFCRLHSDFLGQNRPHCGVILIPQQRYTIGEQARRLSSVTRSHSAAEMRNRLEFLSGWHPTTQ